MQFQQEVDSAQNKDEWIKDSFFEFFKANIEMTDCEMKYLATLYLSIECCLFKNDTVEIIRARWRKKLVRKPALFHWANFEATRDDMFEFRSKSAGFIWGPDPSDEPLTLISPRAIKKED